MNAIKYLVISITWKLSHENVLTDSCKNYLIPNGMDMDERLAILRHFKSISVISGRLEGDNETLCAMESRLRLERFRLQPGPLDHQARA